MRLQIVTLALLAAVLSLPTPVLAQGGNGGSQVVVIVNRANDDASGMTRIELARIYKGQKRSWDRDNPISLYLPPPSSRAMLSLAANVFKVHDANAISRYYIRAIFRNIVSRVPPVVDSTEEAVQRVAADRGAIAVVTSGEIPNPRLIRIIEVDGL